MNRRSVGAPAISAAPGRTIDKISSFLHQRQWLIRVLVVVYVIAISTITYWPQMLDGASFPWDFQGKFTTAPAYVAASISRGDIPTWIQNVGGGMPIFEDPGSGAYYPVWWAAGLSSVPLTLSLMAKIQVAHIAFGALGMTALMRARRFPWFWVACGATAFIMSGMFFGQVQHANFVRGFVFFPWILWAVTPRDTGEPWLRLLAIPPLAYVAAAGIYPGQIASFPLIIGAAVLATLATNPHLVTRRTFVLLGLVGAASVVAVAIVYGPFGQLLGADLDRPNPATVGIRASTSLAGSDFVGLFLNPFTFRNDGTTMAYGLSLPLLLGLAGLNRSTLGKHAPLVAAGGLSLFLGTVSAWRPAARRLLELGPLFSSRFAWADYKVGVVVAMIVLSLAGWQNILASPRRHVSRVTVGGVVAVWLTWLATGMQITDTTSREWAIVGVVILAIGSVALMRNRAEWALILLLLIIIGDGLRQREDHVHLSGQPSWTATTAQAVADQRNVAVANLTETLAMDPERRPARTAPAIDPAVRNQGSPPDSFGYLGLGYRLQRHGGLQTRSLAITLADPKITELMLLPWTPWMVSCADIDCDNLTELPPIDQWRTTDSIVTTRYAQESIDYAVDLDDRILMIENESNHVNWQVDDKRVEPVSHDGAFRAWVLEPGNYEFTARYNTGAVRRGLRLGLVMLGLWGILAIMLLRPRNPAAFGRSGTVIR